MDIKSRNMHYAYNKEYFDRILLNSDEKSVKTVNREIFDFVFPQDITNINGDICSFSNCQFELFTTYPGLFLGLGYPHSSGETNSIAGGFSFDPITGLPLIPGSTIKGILRSIIKDEYTGNDSALKEKNREKNAERKELVCSLLNKAMTDEQYDMFVERVFAGTDVFLDAYPIIEKGSKIFTGEYITAHREQLKDPNPVLLLKVKPGVRYKFMFKLKDYDSEDGMISISVEEKKSLFKELILLFGIGAKTNVGFGQFSANPPIPNNRTKPIPKLSAKNKGETKQGEAKKTEKSESHGKAPKCGNAGCSNEVSWDKNKGGWFRYCSNCAKKYREKKK